MDSLPKILFATGFAGALLEGIDPELGIAGPFSSPIEDNLSTDEAAAVRVLVTIGVMKTGAGLMDLLPNLALICCYGSGYEGVDIAAALARGIMVTHSPAANAASVADLAMGLLLAASRQIVQGDNYVRAGAWPAHGKARLPVVWGLEGRKLGIYGYGAIGAKIADRAAAFDMEIGYCSSAPKSGVPHRYYPTLQSLAEWADVLMVAVRANESNRHAVDAKVMRGLGPQGIVINIARGSVIDEAAMIGLLQSGELGNAGLDVFEHEPAVPEALRNIPQVVLTPHLGGATQHSLDAMGNMVAANIASFFATGKVLTPVPEMAG